ncbi:SDR family NAD(P)-dependent oxidoreductase [Mycolicibacterium gilvum]|uniref:Dehydrogenase n=1 Tax=Mycolicibacterium gilvum TaxID=1804 RepID=A0A378SMY3_9MYCO|nr:SDR family NAD(P)-dependent oxidoreductase [Mycolicibacterium gilvum]MCV7056147.1 SDR family NAD(P)-dependent oxidoreductase [Mycolicibacterium gilvum]STZ44162.1 dehydrogenase [Mycolicibacterium gilvum]
MGIMEGRVAIVTGGGRGIGGAVARLFAREGATVVINDIGASLSGLESDGNPALELAHEIEQNGGTAITNGADISDHEAARDLVESTIERFGKLDVLVNVAGILRDRMIFNMTEEEWDAVIRVHLKGHFNTIRPAAAYWRKLDNPNAQHRIINYTSRAGLHGAPGQPNYSAAKMGIVGLTYSCAFALKKYGVTTNAVSPAAATRMTATIKDDAYSTGGNELSPDSIAPIAAYLGSEQSGWLNGHVVHARGYEVSLYSDPEPLVTLRSEGPWDLQEMAKEVETQFRPITEAAPPNPFI